MIQLNLLPELKKEYIKSQKTKALVITASVFVTLGAIGLSVLLFVYVTLVQQLQIGLATDDIERKMADLQSIQDIDKYVTVQNQLASLPELHDSKGQYSRLFSFMDVLNPSAPNNVTLSEMRLTGEDQSITFTGTTASFEALNTFVDTLKNASVSYLAGGEGEPVEEKIFSQALVQSADIVRSGNQTGVGFTVRALYNEAAFDMRNTDVKASVPDIRTTPSVTDSPSPQLFNNGNPGGE